MNPDFEKILNDADIPTTNDGWLALLRQKITDTGSVFSNNSAYSPLMRLFEAVMIIPAMLLVQLMIKQWLPQSFVMTATGVWLDLLARGYGVERKAAQKLQGLITFNRVDGNGSLTINAGTVVQSVPVNGVVYKLSVVADTIIADGTQSLQILCEAESEGAAFNLADGYYSVLPVGVSGIATVNNHPQWINQIGADIESDDDLKARVVNQFSAINQWHTDAVYRSIISQFSGVKANNVFFQHGAPRGAGTADAYILFETGNPSAQLLQEIQDEIMVKGNHGIGDDVAIFAMPETQHDIELTLYPAAPSTAAEHQQLQIDVHQYIRCVFRENLAYPDARKVMPFERFSFSQLTRELEKQFPLIHDLDFTSAAIIADIDIPRINNLTITVAA